VAAISAQSRPPDVVRLLADDVRWRLVRALARSDHRVRELVHIVEAPYNLVSYHLKQLKTHGLVAEHRSSRDARDIYYALDLEALRQQLEMSADSVHPALRREWASERLGGDEPVFLRRPRVLILCTHNSARSQMAEGILRSLSHSQIDVVSAGSEPTRVNPEAIAAMSRIGIDIAAHRSKSFTDLVGERFDYIVTVCDRVREICPVFPGEPEHIHWSFPSPAEVDDPTERARAFDQTALGLMTRSRHLLTMLIREQGTKSNG
jgi:protein-tyrosine-phosphatase/DNA-binding transcriptional ArsR family regulator